MTVQVGFFPFIGLVALAGVLVGRHSPSLDVGTALKILLPSATVLYTIYYSWIYPFYVSPLRHIPTVPGFPLWGQFFTIITTEVGVAQREWHQKYGPIVRYFFPFGSERLSVADDDAIKQMTVRNPYNYPKPDRARAWMRPVLGDGTSEAEIQHRTFLTVYRCFARRGSYPCGSEKGSHAGFLYHFDPISDAYFLGKISALGSTLGARD